MTTTAAHLWTVIRYWPDLQNALGDKATATWPPAGRMADHIRDLEQHDADQEAHERSQALLDRVLERADSDPTAAGQRPIPIRLSVHDTLCEVHEALTECADRIASSVQRPVMGPLPAGYPEADRRRRALLVMRDERDPRRWRWTGPRLDAPRTALWLLARVTGAPGPFRPLTAAHLDDIGAVARAAARRVEAALDVAEGTAELTDPCPRCGGRLTMHGGGGASPVAHCTACGRVWGGSCEAEAPTARPTACP